MLHDNELLKVLLLIFQESENRMYEKDTTSRIESYEVYLV